MHVLVCHDISVYIYTVYIYSIYSMSISALLKVSRQPPDTS